HFREDDRFTGKEEDVEVGLVYFGFRYYAPALGGWVSPDPLAVESLEADLNVYAYVQGRVLASTDPVGLDPAQVNVDFGAGSESLVSVVPGLPGEKDLLTRNVAEYEAYRTSAPVEFVNSRGGIPLQYLGPMNEMARPSAGPSFAETVAQRMGEIGGGPSPFAVEGSDAAVTAPGATVAGRAGGDGKLTPGHRGGATKLDQAVALTGIWGFSADLDPEKGKSGGLVGGLCPSCDGSAGGQALYTAASLVPIGKAGALLTKLTKKHYRAIARNPALAARYLTEAEQLAGRAMDSANFGKALERAVGRDVERNYNHVLQYVSRPGKAGPDFRGVGRSAGQTFDITTIKAQAAHYARAYGRRLRLILYGGKPKKWP
ncbi:MAG: RHS repeat-associated core domain-containing protein, partial [Polyangiaceae bacterium]